MANTKKTTTTKKATVQEPVVQEAVKKVEPAKKVPKKFAPEERIECRSVTAGELILVGDKTKLQYTWSDFNDVAYVEYQDLQSLQSRKSSFLTKPLFIIEDDEVVEQWSTMLKPIYDAFNNQSIEELFSLAPDKVERALNKMPEGIKEAVKTKAAAMIQSRELFDIRIIEVIDKVLETELKEMLIG